MHKILIADNLAETGINFLNEQAGQHLKLIGRADIGGISALSGVLANANINVTRMQAGITVPVNGAMAVISATEPLGKNLLAAVYELPEVNSATQVVI